MASITDIHIKANELEALRDLDGSYKKRYSEMGAIKKVITKIKEFFIKIIDSLRLIFTPERYALKIFNSYVMLCKRIDENILNKQLNSVQSSAIKKIYQFMISVDPDLDTKSTFPNIKKIYHPIFFSQQTCSIF